MAQNNKKTVRGKATILAIGTAVPPSFIYQSDYPDYYFQITKSDHLTELKQKFTRLCTEFNIKKRYYYATDEELNNQRSLVTQKEQSLDPNALLLPGVMKLGKEAAEQAIHKWGQPRSRITHLIFHTTTGSIHMPGPDYQLYKLLGLEPTVNRCMLYPIGCHAGGTVIRIAKDLAENNPGSRILAICSESTDNIFRSPSESSMDTLLAHALFGNGAGAVILGSDPDMFIERPLYEILSAGQSIIPGTENALGGRGDEGRLELYLSRTVPMHITNNIRKHVSTTFQPLGISDWNSLFWVVHPGAPQIIDGIETELKLEKDKLLPSRHVLAEFGNMASGNVIFVMDEMKKRSRGTPTTGEGAEFGVVLGFGPGITIETVVLRALTVLD